MSSFAFETRSRRTATDTLAVHQWQRFRAGGASEIEVTLEMIEAGLPHLLCFHRESSNDEAVVNQIYRAMARARRLAS